MKKVGLFTKLFCRHSEVHVTRWHRNCVTPDMQRKELYVDRLGVYNFVTCSRCYSILRSTQSPLERLFEQKADAP